MSDHDVSWVAGLVGPLRVRPGSKVSLPRDFDPGARFGVRKKKDGARLLGHGVELLAGYQDRLAAQDTYALLVVLQAMDAAGKDSTIRHVMSGVNPQGVHVSSFKAPTADSASPGMTTSMPTPRCSPIPAPSGLPGTSCPPTTSGSPGSAPQPSSPIRSSRSTRDTPSPMHPPGKSCCRRELRLKPRRYRQQRRPAPRRRGRARQPAAPHPPDLPPWNPSAPDAMSDLHTTAPRCARDARKS